MSEIVELTEEGRKKLHTFQKEPSHNSLSELANFAQEEFLKLAPPLKGGKKRSNLDSVSFGTASNWCSYIRKKVKQTKQILLQDNNDTPSNVT